MSCPVPGCRVKPRTGHLMCKPHWYMVSPETRRDVNSTWANRRKGLGPYATARNAAIAEVEAKLHPANQPELF